MMINQSDISVTWYAQSLTLQSKQEHLVILQNDKIALCFDFPKDTLKKLLKFAKYTGVFNGLQLSNK